MLELQSLSIDQYGFIGNVFSFGLAVMASTTLFLWLMMSSAAPTYRMAITISGLVTAIAAYHYLQIMLSWDGAASVASGEVVVSGEGFNRAYRYVDWLLTVPLLLVELILVMKLSKAETLSRSIRLGGAAALMIVLGYPGEVAGNVGTRAIFWILSMIPFIYIVRELVIGLKESISKQPDNVKGLISKAAILVVASWAFYPIVYLLPLLGVTGGSAIVVVETGYTIADIMAKAVFGLLIFVIAIRKSEAEADVNAVEAAPAEQASPVKKGS
ncbi:xanthorhodopsin [Marinobacter psychrophilus]|jgi:bacteriorhodopsin|uniref:Xanthorhodopsin n=1 Tax=Marinobacter psychrophilus TaxID=330734 RepID=A0A0H4IBT6_9GAMM|nr:bacteriorhodopsin-like [Marinobacter psychrophilus]AKO52517.1 xanthorhodopsin [Marinobacter psychrophilus]